RPTTSAAMTRDQNGQDHRRHPATPQTPGYPPNTMINLGYAALGPDAASVAQLNEKTREMAQVIENGPGQLRNGRHRCHFSVDLGHADGS
ncbi:hypothetical protein, partial [Micromonospora sicca]|uniref:hypothetical protein n=1 Tax=Micromonospora sicca TaxID=2202420 RepID=UPI001F282AF5